MPAISPPAVASTSATRRLGTLMYIMANAMEVSSKGKPFTRTGTCKPLASPIDTPNSQVVTDNGVITSRNPGDLEAFSAKIIEEIREGRHQRRDRHADRQPLDPHRRHQQAAEDAQHGALADRVAQIGFAQQMAVQFERQEVGQLLALLQGRGERHHEAAVLGAHDGAFEAAQRFEIDDGAALGFLLQLAQNGRVARRNVLNRTDRFLFGRGNVESAGDGDAHAAETAALLERTFDDLLSRFL